MAQKGIIINTNASGHVDADDFAKIIKAISTKGPCLLDDGEVITVTKQSDNLLRLSGGLLLMSNGVVIRVDSPEDVKVQSGTLGYNRYDLLIAEYIKNGEEDGTDTAIIRVVQGDYSTGIPDKPALARTTNKTQDLLATLYVEGTEMHIESVDVKKWSNENTTAELETAINDKLKKNMFFFNDTSTILDLYNAFQDGKVYVYYSGSKFDPSYGRGIVLYSTDDAFKFLIADDSSDTLYFWSCGGVASNTLIINCTKKQIA